MIDNSMIPKRKLIANYIAWGVVYAIAGVIYGLIFHLGIYINVFLALLAASIAVNKFLFGASLAVINMTSTVITLLIYCSISTNQSCKSNPIILGSFTPVIAFMIWLILFGSAKFTKTIRSKYTRPIHREDK